jgi:hypothetical protein
MSALLGFIYRYYFFAKIHNKFNKALDRGFILADVKLFCEYLHQTFNILGDYSLPLQEIKMM